MEFVIINLSIYLSSLFLLLLPLSLSPPSSLPIFDFSLPLEVKPWLSHLCHRLCVCRQADTYFVILQNCHLYSQENQIWSNMCTYLLVESSLCCLVRGGEGAYSRLDDLSYDIEILRCAEKHQERKKCHCQIIISRGLIKVRSLVLRYGNSQVARGTSR